MDVAYRLAVNETCPILAFSFGTHDGGMTNDCASLKLAALPFATVAHYSMSPSHQTASDNLARLHAACQHLHNLGPRWQALMAHIGPCSHQTHPHREPYEALIRAVAYQQLTTRAGDAMIRRLLAAYSVDGETFPSAQQIALSDSAQLRQCGFSTRKADTLLAIAQGALTGQVPDREQALAMDDDALLEKLCALKGIGRWTVEMFLIYSLERMDIMPLDDLGIRLGLSYLHGKTRIPSRRELAQLSAPCQPYSTIAAWYLWRSPMMPDYADFKQALKTAKHNG